MPIQVNEKLRKALKLQRIFCIFSLEDKKKKKIVQRMGLKIMYQAEENILSLSLVVVLVFYKRIYHCINKSFFFSKCGYFIVEKNIHVVKISI